MINCDYVTPVIDASDEMTRLRLVGQSLEMKCHKIEENVFLGTNDSLKDKELKIRCLNISCKFNLSNKNHTEGMSG